MQHNNSYTLIFSFVVCIVCGVLISSAAVSLLERQNANALLDKQKNVLEAAGLRQPGEALSAAQVKERFKNVESVAFNIETGQEDPSFDLTGYDQLKAAADPARSLEAPPNPSAIRRLPRIAQIYKVKDADGNLGMVVLPIEGLGLWGTLYGFLAVDRDGATVRGITYYQHKETPGLGGEVDNPRWKALWPGRKLYSPDGKVALQVIKGPAGPVDQAPHNIDGLSGATITSRGVTDMIRFWLSDSIYGKYLRTLATPPPAGAAS